MKIVILNVKYSPNLGDGAIAECLEAQITQSIPHAMVSSIDIGGMDDYGIGGSIISKKLSLSRFLDVLPSTIKSKIKSYLMPVMVFYKYHKKWKEKLVDCDAIIIGGGHLFMDVDNYFPSRIMTAVKAAPKGIKIYIHAVGVSKRWTTRGKKFFENAFSHGTLCATTVRDSQSLTNWNEVFPNIPAEICRDPAILADECYSIKRNKKLTGKLVGLGVADMGNMAQHADQDIKIICGNFDSYIEIIKNLHNMGCDIVLFTNGGDDPYLTSLVEYMKENNSDLHSIVKIAPRPLKPIELVNLIGTFDVMIAHRLHANILAYSLSVPSIGLGWDRKLESFMVASGRGDFLVRSDDEAGNISNMLNLIFTNKTKLDPSIKIEAKQGSKILISNLLKK